MREKRVETERDKRLESYMLANKNPWLLWRLQAFRAGHTPPLIIGQLPQNYAQMASNGQAEHYDIDPLLKHADKIRHKQHNYLKRTFIIVILSVLIFSAISITLAVKDGSKFRIGILDAIVPRIDSRIDIQSD